MEYGTEIDTGRLIVTLSGILTFDDHEKFRSVVTVIADSDVDTVVVDLAALTMIDSAGIGMLLLANDRAGKQGKNLRLRGMSGHVAKVVEMSKLEQLIPID
ncbi:STAS domain-containing protein [Maricaulis sp.]|uniref:STAS domain-containing protein n=1 Tax=Maricaulis sp. TaxID=1486257 RepID=UPI002615C9EB|nr:STAS domain-containing protein [Maricaulis sp.]